MNEGKEFPANKEQKKNAKFFEGLMKTLIRKEREKEGRENWRSFVEAITPAFTLS